MKRNQSHQTLSTSMTRRVYNLMTRTLSNFDRNFNFVEVETAENFKHDLKNSFNDVIRAMRDELEDYDIDYRPFRYREDNIVAITTTFMSTVQKIEFTNKPSIKIYSSIEKVRVLDAVRNEFGTGVLYIDDSNPNSIILEIVGLKPCIDIVIPIMDKYKLHTSVKDIYVNWRESLVKQYIKGDVNHD